MAAIGIVEKLTENLLSLSSQVRREDVLIIASKCKNKLTWLRGTRYFDPGNRLTTSARDAMSQIVRH
jgi:hypothetical protein